MMLMVTIGYVFSYLIPTKQKSVSLVVSSNQTFFLAQSGVEFAVRFASDNGLSSLSSPITRNLGRGSFTITYEPTPVDRLTSDGQIPNASQRKIVVRNFSQFVTLSPCWITPNQVARFYITNESPSNVTLNAFEASWTHTSNTTRLREIFMGPPGGTMTSRYSNNPGLDTPVAKTNLSTTQIISSGQTLEINVRWAQPRVSGFTITFYSTTGGSYTFNFASGLPNCP